MATRAKQLNLDINLDERIDEVAKRITDTLDVGTIAAGPALLMGDAVRLQQIITNLT